MRFFRPRPEFFAWIGREYETRNQPVIDCGCGDGALLGEMMERGIGAIGLDPRYIMYDEPVPFALVSRLLTMPAEESTIVRNTPAILLVCRPCHDRFPLRIDEHRHPDSVLYYVGLTRNLILDLGETETRLVLENVGEDGENIWEVNPQRLARAA